MFGERPASSIVAPQEDSASISKQIIYGLVELVMDTLMEDEREEELVL